MIVPFAKVRQPDLQAMPSPEAKKRPGGRGRGYARSQSPRTPRRLSPGRDESGGDGPASGTGEIAIAGAEAEAPGHRGRGRGRTNTEAGIWRQRLRSGSGVRLWTFCRISILLTRFIPPPEVTCKLEPMIIGVISGSPVPTGSHIMIRFN